MPKFLWGDPADIEVRREELKHNRSRKRMTREQRVAVWQAAAKDVYERRMAAAERAKKTWPLGAKVLFRIRLSATENFESVGYVFAHDDDYGFVHVGLSASPMGHGDVRVVAYDDPVVDEHEGGVSVILL